jgi:Mg2+ and Co2+ transporter CorA
MCVTSSQESLHKNNAAFLINHMKTVYFQMVILLLAQRTSILRFSDEITAISDIEEGNKDLTKKISNLHKHYLRFKNKLYFKEVTPQEQGIELYDKARDVMRIDSDIQDLSYEIHSLNSYAFIEEEKLEKEQMNKLTKLGTYLLPPTLMAGIFGMNVFGEKTFQIDNNWNGIMAFGVLSVVSVFVMTFFIKDKNESV